MSAAQAEPALVVRRGTDRDVEPVTPSEPFRSWQQRAACRDTGCDVFFPLENEAEPARRGRERAAKVICAGCPVRRPCAVHALVNREIHGVWGGLSESDRAWLSNHL